MTGVRSIRRWGSLAAMVLGAAASVALTALVQACSGKTDTTDEVVGDSGDKDGKAEGGDADAAEASSDQQADDIVPQNDVTLDHAPAE